MSGARVNIADKLFTTLKNDAGAGSIQALTGADSGDPRVYQSFGDTERKIDSTYPAYVVIIDVTEPPAFLARQETIYQVTIVSKSRNRARSIQDRVDALLEHKSLAATGWSDVSMTRSLARQGYDAGAGVFQIMHQYNIKVWS